MRGLLAGVDIEKLRRDLEQEPKRSLLAKVQADFAEVAAAMKTRTNPYIVGNCASGCVTAMELEAACLHRLTGSAAGLEHVQAMIDVLERTWITAPPKWHIRGGGTLTSYFSQALTCLAADMCRQTLDERRQDLLRRMVREFFIRDDGFPRVFRFSGGHNIAVTRAISAGVCALVYGQESGHPEWESYVDFARDTCLQYARWGLDPAGYSYEGVGYGYTTAVYWMYLFAQLLLQNGRDNLFVRLPVLGRIPDAIAHILFPDGSTLAQISDMCVPQSLPWLCLTARHYHRPHDLDVWRRYKAGAPPQLIQGLDLEKWHTFRGNLLSLIWLDPAVIPAPLEHTPLPTAMVSPGTETANFRSSWRQSAVYLNVLGQGRSNGSLGHMHADGGHFSLYAHGRYLAVDSGYWNDLEDQHNVVLVDGKNSRHDCQPQRTAYRAGKLSKLQRSPLLDYLCVDQAAVKDCRWANRHVLFLRGEGDQAVVVTIDDINPDDSHHEFWWQLHAHPAARLSIAGPQQATLERDGAALDCSFVIPSAADFPTDPHRLELAVDDAWCPAVKAEDRPRARAEALAIAGNDLGNSSSWRPRLLAKLSGLNCMLMSVLIPRRDGAPQATVEAITQQRILHARIQHGPFTDTVISALGHGMVQLDELSGPTELAVIRRDAAGKLVGYWTVEGAAVRLGKG